MKTKLVQKDYEYISDVVNNLDADKTKCGTNTRDEWVFNNEESAVSLFLQFHDAYRKYKKCAHKNMEQWILIKAKLISLGKALLNHKKDLNKTSIIEKE